MGDVSKDKFMYSGGVEPHPYDIVGMGLCSTFAPLL